MLFRSCIRDTAEKGNELKDVGFRLYSDADYKNEVELYQCNVGQRFGHGGSYAGSAGTAAERSAGNLAVCRRAGKRP